LQLSLDIVSIRKTIPSLRIGLLGVFKSYFPHANSYPEVNIKMATMSEPLHLDRGKLFNN